MFRKVYKHQSQEETWPVHINMEGDFARWDGMSDEDIWKEFKAGSKDALIYIYKVYFPVLFSYAYQFNKDRELIKDLIQDLFVYCYKKKKSISNTNSIKYYLFRSLRRKIRLSIEKQDKFEDLSRTSAFGIDSSPESLYISNEEQNISQQELKSAISKLPVRQREIIYYYYYENFSYKEIASILEFKQVKSARKLLYRAVDNLKKELNHDIFSI